MVNGLLITLSTPQLAQVLLPILSLNPVLKIMGTLGLMAEMVEAISEPGMVGIMRSVMTTSYW